MTVRASLPIQRGEQIYASYALSLDGISHFVRIKFPSGQIEFNFSSIQEQKSGEPFYDSASFSNVIVIAVQIQPRFRLSWVLCVVKNVERVSSCPSAHWMNRKPNGAVTFARIVWRLPSWTVLSTDSKRNSNPSDPMKWTSKNKNDKANHEFLDCFFCTTKHFLLVVTCWTWADMKGSFHDTQGFSIPITSSSRAPSSRWANYMVETNTIYWILWRRNSWNAKWPSVGSCWLLPMSSSPAWLV